MKLKVNKTIAKMMLERVRGEPTKTRSELSRMRPGGRSKGLEKKAHAKASRQWDKRVAAGADDPDADPELTISDIIYDIPSIKINNGNMTLPAGKTVKGEENLERYLGNLGMAFAWNEPEVMPHADKLDKLFNIHNDAVLSFVDQYQQAADERDYQERQDSWYRDMGESKMIRIKRSDLTRAVHQIISEDRIGGATAIGGAVSQQMQGIQQEREELAGKMKIAISANDVRATENIQNRLKELDKAAAELTDAQTDNVNTLSPEAIPSDDDPAKYTTIEAEGKIRRSELRALIREAEKELSDLKPIGQMSDEELKAKYHPEDTLADAVHYAISAEGDGGEASWEIIKGVMDKVRATLTPAKDDSRGPSAEERRLTQQIMAGNFHKRLQDMAKEVSRDLGWIE
jgi:hypothetical protein